MAGAVTAASLAEAGDPGSGSDPAEDRRASREDRAAARREAKQAKAEAKQARRREKNEARAMAKARRERHSIEARVEREKAASEPAVEPEKDAVEPEDATLVQDEVVEETPVVEESQPQAAPDDAAPDDAAPEAAALDDAKADGAKPDEAAPDTEGEAEQPPVIDQDTAVALAVESARPESVSRLVDPIRVASDALDREDAETETQAEAEAAAAADDVPSRPRDAVSASLSDRAAAQLAKRRRREEERAAREAEKSAKNDKDEAAGKSEESGRTAALPAVDSAEAEGSGSTDRVRQSALTAWDVPEPRAPRAEDEKRSGRVWGAIVSVVGIVGYVCAVLLAVGAMTVALGLESGDAIFDLVSPVCDVLVSPARGLVSFSGENAETKELFLAYSLGSIVYLVIGLVAQNLPKRQD